MSKCEKIFDVDPWINHQMNAIEDMLKDAEKNGLSVEVVWQFAVELQSRSTIPEAISCARREWDI